MPKKYEIKWVIDDAQARGVFARGVKGMQAIEAAMAKTGTAIEQASSKTAAKMASVAVTADATMVKSARKRANDIGKIEDEQAKRNLRTATKDAAAREALRLKELAGIKRNSDAEARYQASQALGPAGRLAQVKRKALSDDILGAAAYNRHMDSYHQRRIAQIQQQRYGSRAAFVEAIANATGFGNVMSVSGGAAAAAVTAVGVAAASVVVGFGTLVNQVNKIRDAAIVAAEATNSMKKGLRMESTLKGYTGMSNEALKEALTFRTTTGLGESEASDLTRQYLGSLPIGLEKGNITPEVAKALMTQVGITQAWQGGDAGTRGDLAGVLGQFSKIGTVETGLGQMEAIRQGLTAGRGDDPVLTAQLLKTAGSIVREGGSVGSLPEMAALIGATSLSAGPEAAGMRAEHLNRALRGGLLRHTKRKGAKMSQADYMKSLGITEKTDMEGFLGAIVPDVMKAKAAGRDIETYLGEHGLSNSEERRAVMEMVPIYDAVKSRMERARGAQDGSKILEANKRFLQSPEGQAAVAKQLGDVRTVTTGLNTMRFAAAIESAEASPEVQSGDKSAITSTIGDYIRGLATGNLPILGDPMGEGRKNRIKGQAIRDLNKAAREAGVTEGELGRAAWESGGATDVLAEYTNRVQGLMMSRGGDTSIRTEAAMARLAEAMEKANKLEEGRRKAVPTTPIPLPVVPLAAGVSR